MTLRLALFDLDHTLLPIDSDYAWGQFTIELGWTDPASFARRNAFDLLVGAKPAHAEQAKH